jgi:hypothetical protein
VSDHDPFGWDDPGPHDPGPHDPDLHDPGAGPGGGWPEPDLPGYEHALDADDASAPGGDPPWAGSPGAGLPDLSDLGDLSDTPGEGFGDGFGDGAPGPAGAAAHPGGLLDTWPVGADPDHTAEPHGPAELFPPALDVPLPEPVDGYPWADPALLGGAAIGAPPDAPASAADPAGLAAYAGVELPPDADPWAVLADSDDPATSALARWWAPDPPATG